MATTVVGNGAIAMGGEEEHLVLESIRAQRPTMAKHDGLPSTPVIEVDLGAVLCGDRAHFLLRRMASSSINVGSSIRRSARRRFSPYRWALMRWKAEQGYADSSRDPTGRTPGITA